MHINRLFLIILTGYLSSCSNNDNRDGGDNTKPPITIAKKTYTYQFNNSYKIENGVSLKGPKGTETSVDVNMLNQYWFSVDTSDEKLVIDYKKDSLFVINGKLKRAYKIKAKQDSIFLDGTKPEFFGFHTSDKIGLTIYKRVIVYHRAPRENDNSSLYSRSGLNFGRTSHQEVSKISPFKTPSEMVSGQDFLIWANLSYSYKEIK